MTKHQKKIIESLKIILIIILLLNLVDAFGVASSYWKGNPLTISPGETKVAYLSLQNMVGTEDVSIKASLKKGSEIASTEEIVYLVRAGTKDTQVPITVSIPENVSLNSKYEVIVAFQTVTSGDTGAVALGTAIQTTFDVLVAAQPEVVEEGKAWQPWQVMFLLIAVIILLIIIVLIILHKKRKSRRAITENKKSLIIKKGITAK